MNYPDLTIKQLTSSILEKTALDRKVYLSFNDVVIKLKTNSADLAAKLTHYFKDFIIHKSTDPQITILALDKDTGKFDLQHTVKQPDPGKIKIKEEYVDLLDGRLVFKRLTGMSFLFGKGTNIAVGNCVKNDNQVVNFINNRYIQWLLNNKYILGHAAAVKNNGVGISIAGFSGAGKSTLALHLMNRGTTFISNDRLLITKNSTGLIMSGVAKLPRINPGTIVNNPSLKSIIPDEEVKKFKEMPKDKLWNLEQKYDVFIDKVFGENKFDLSGTMNALFILNWDRDHDHTDIRKIDIEKRRDLLGAFIKSPGLFYEPDHIDAQENLTEETYIDHLKMCSVYEVTGGVNFDYAADYIRKITRDGE